jgi:hypothetical protein
MAVLTPGSYELIPGINQVPARELDGTVYRATTIKRNLDGSSPLINITEVYTDHTDPTKPIQYGLGTTMLKSKHNNNSYVKTNIKISAVVLSKQVIADVDIPAKIRRLQEPAVGGRRKSRRRHNRKARKSTRSRR